MIESCLGILASLCERICLLPETLFQKYNVDNVEDPLSDMNDVTYSYYMHYYVQVDYSV